MGRSSGDVGKAVRKGKVSHSTAIILRRAEAPNCYVRVGASHDFTDDIFDDAVETDYYSLTLGISFGIAFRTLPNFSAC